MTELAAERAVALAGDRRIALGCMALTGIYGRVDRAEAIATLRAALDHGIRLFDTAALYSDGGNEALLGDVLGDRTDILISTKFGLVVDASGSLRRDSAPSAIRASINASLRRLCRDRIDLALQHRPDPAVPAAAVAEVMDGLVREGKVAAFGVSGASNAYVRELASFMPMMAVQDECSLIAGQGSEQAIARAAELGLVFMAYAPLARGVLCWPDDRTTTKGDYRFAMPGFQVPGRRAAAPIAAALRAEAERIGASSASLALAWAVAQGPHVVPIIGARSADHLASALVTRGRPSDDVLTRLEAARHAWLERSSVPT